MSEKPFIRANTGVQDSLLFNPTHSPFAYQAPLTISNFIKAEQYLDPNNRSNNLGVSQRFEIPKEFDLLGPVELVLQLAPLIQGDPPIEREYVENVCSLIENVRIQYGSSLLTDINPDWIFTRFIKYFNFEAKQAWRPVAGFAGYKAGGSAKAINGGEFVIPIPVPWGDDTSQYFSTVAMAEKLTLTVRLRSADHAIVVKPSGTPFLAVGQVPLVSNIQLHLDGIHLTGEERDELVKAIKAPEGLAKLYEDIQIQNGIIVPTSSTTFRVQLTNVTQPVRSLFFFFIDPLDVAGNNTRAVSGSTSAGFFGDSPYHIENAVALQVNRWRVYSGSKDLITWRSYDRSANIDHVKYFSGSNPGLPLFGYSHSLAPETPNANEGSINYGQIDAPTLEIEFTGNPVVQTELHILADTLNFWHEQGGDVQKTFH
jgi:hypothetical protein